MMYCTNLRALAGIIWDSGAASITDCQVFVDPGMTKPNSKTHSVMEMSHDLVTCDVLYMDHKLKTNYQY